MLRIEVPLTLTIEVPDTETAEKYLDTTTRKPSLDYIADLFDDDTITFILYRNEENVVAINGLTQENVRQALSERIP